MASPQNDALSVAAPAATGYGGRVAPAPPPPPPPPPAPALTLVPGTLSAAVGVAATGWRVDNTGSVPAQATVTVPGDVTSSFTPQTIAAGAQVAFTLTALIAGAKSVALSSSTPGAVISGSPATFTGTSAPTPPPPPPPPAPSAGAMQLTLTSSASGTLPFAAGFAFRQGDIPAGQGIAVAGATAQANIKTTWPDGSAKIAVIAGTYTSAGSPVTLTMSAGTASSGTALTTTDLQAALTQPVTVDAGGLGSASWSGADWASPFATWVSGHRMSSWIYRKAVGSDAHLVAWLEVRLYAGGAVEILPWVENGYVNVASPTNKSTTYGFTLGGTSRFSAAIDLKHHQRTPLLSGAALSHWLGTDPGVTLRHDVAYLQATELVPSYRVPTPAGAAVVSAVCPTSFTPLQQGGYTYSSDTMSSGGAAQPIGLLPAHDVLYLTCAAADAARVYKAVVFNGYSAGRYRHHYRDETTNRPPAFTAYPTLVLAGGSSTTSTYTPTPSGGEAPERDIAHHPSVGFMAYLVTGRWYFMEEALLSASFNHFAKTDSAIMRDGAKGLFQSCFGGYQTRASAWAMRTFAQALAIIPDADALRTEFLTVWHHNVDKYHAQYVTQPGNPWGWVEPGEDYGLGLQHGAPWQQDFHAAAVGYARALDLTADATRKSRWAAFHAWKAQCTIKRLGPASAFWYINGAPYVQLISASALTEANFRDGTGTFYTEAQSYAQLAAGLTAASSPTSWIGTTEGILGGEIMPGEMSMWGNLMPSLAYAVRFGITGALEALFRVKSSRNWEPLNQAFAANPVWGVQAAADEFVRPAWMGSAPLYHWIEIGGTSGAALAQVDPWGALTVTPDGRLLISCSGGHNDSPDNRVVSIDLIDDAPGWEILENASSSFQENVSHYTPDGHPTSRHLYQNIFYIPARDRIFHVGAQAAFGGPAPAFASVDAYNVSGRTWDPAGTYAPVPEGDGTYKAGNVFDGAVVWSNTLRTYNPHANVWADGARFQYENNGIIEAPWAFDSRRQQIFGLSWGTGRDSETGTRCARVPVTGSSKIAVAVTANATRTEWESERPGYAGMDYDPINDRFLFFHGVAKNSFGTVTGYLPGKVYTASRVSDNEYALGLLTLTGTPPGNTVGAGINGRFRFVPRLRGFVYLPQRTSNLFFFRVG